MVRKISPVADYVRVMKTARVPGGEESLAVGHWLEGLLINPPHCGEPVRVLRLVTNGRKALGVFRTTCVVDMRPGAFRTRNSLYELRAQTIPARITLSEEEYKVALARAETLMAAAPGTHDEAEFEAWTLLIEKYEAGDIKD